MNDKRENKGQSFLSDLACERRRANTNLAGIEFRRESSGSMSWERIKVTSEEGASSIGRPIGNYDTLNTGRMDKLTPAECEDAECEVARELERICEANRITPEKILVVGLGNAELTPDSIGPKCAGLVNATMHIKNFDTGLFGEVDFSKIAVVSPGVMASSGLEAFDSIYGITDRISPDVIFAIDSLASRSRERLGSTIQISDTGIFPGSGVGNTRLPLCRTTLGVPVIAIGVPTVINATAFLAGDDEEVMKRIRKKNPTEDEMFVCPREINDIVSGAAKIISGGINQAFGLM